MKKYMCLEVSDGTTDGYLYGYISGNGAIEARYIGKYVQPKNIHPMKALLYDKVEKEFSDAVYEVYTYGPEKLKLMINELAFKQRAKSYIQNMKALLYDKVEKEFSDAVYEVYTYGPEKLKLMINELAFKQRAKSYIQNAEMSEERMKVFLLQNNLLDKMYETMLSVGISEDRFPVILSVIAKEGLE